MGRDIDQIVAEFCGTAGDETIRTYIAAVLKLGDFDFGREGENAYDSFGPMLVSYLIYWQQNVHLRKGWV